jgi:hypothetical protein
MEIESSLLHALRYVRKQVMKLEYTTLSRKMIHSLSGYASQLSRASYLQTVRVRYRLSPNSAREAVSQMSQNAQFVVTSSELLLLLTVRTYAPNLHPVPVSEASQLIRENTCPVF